MLGATGASLLAPVVLLLTAAAVAASGGGLGGLGSLGQLTSGPELPDIGLASSSFEDSGSAEIVGAQVGEPAGTAATSLPGSGGELLAGGPGVAGLPRVPQSPGDGTGQAPPTTAPTPVTTPNGEITPGNDGDAPTTTTPAPADPVGQVIDETRDLGEALPGPLGPVTTGILDLLLGPRK
jgi:hypothetical protein